MTFCFEHKHLFYNFRLVTCVTLWPHDCMQNGSPLLCATLDLRCSLFTPKSQIFVCWRFVLMEAVTHILPPNLLHWMKHAAPIVGNNHFILIQDAHIYYFTRKKYAEINILPVSFLFRKFYRIWKIHTFSLDIPDVSQLSLWKNRWLSISSFACKD